METPNPRIRRSLVGLIRGNAHRTTLEVDERPPRPQVWADATEMLADQFASPSARS